MSARMRIVGSLAVVAALAAVPASLRSQTPSEHRTLTFGVKGPTTPQHRDCQVYNPETLTIQHLDTGVWRLQDGGHWIVAFGSEAEGKNALALAQRFRELCYIGRMNGRPPDQRGDYIVTYWQGDSGKRTAIDPEYCQLYDPAKLRIAYKSGAGWIVTDEGFTLTLSSEEDATAALALAKEHQARCTIGKYVNSPGQPRTSRLDYWK